MGVESGDYPKQKIAYLSDLLRMTVETEIIDFIQVILNIGNAS